MGASKYFNGSADSLPLMEVETANLKDKLNAVYDALRRQNQNHLSSGLFEYLWDLKELALAEGAPRVQVPTQWLEELQACSDSARS